MAGIFTAGETRLRPGVYYRIENRGSANQAGTKNGAGSIVSRAPILMTTEDGDLYVVYNNENIAISFELDNEGDLYAINDGEYSISFELDDNGNLYVLEE